MGMGEEKLQSERVQSVPLEKARTFIPGLDDILEGGLPRGRTTILHGASGSGKTLVALEFVYRGALNGEAGIFVSCEESVEQLRQNAATLGWDLPAQERANQLFLLDGRIRPDTLASGDFSVKGLLAIVSGKRREMSAKQIAIDALEVMLRLFDTPRQVRSEMHALNDWLQEAGMTSILTGRPPSRFSSPFEDFFDSMGDCVIRLDARVSEQVTTRRLRVTKYRGSGTGRNEYPYVIGEGGFRAAPISTVGLRHKPSRRRSRPASPGWTKSSAEAFAEARASCSPGCPARARQSWRAPSRPRCARAERPCSTWASRSRKPRWRAMSAARGWTCRRTSPRAA